jgi:hypothetical protein
MCECGRIVRDIPKSAGGDVEVPTVPSEIHGYNFKLRQDLEVFTEKRVNSFIEPNFNKESCSGIKMGTQWVQEKRRLSPGTTSADADSTAADVLHQHSSLPT